MSTTKPPEINRVFTVVLAMSTEDDRNPISYQTLHVAAGGSTEAIDTAREKLWEIHCESDKMPPLNRETLAALYGVAAVFEGFYMNLAPKENRRG